MFLLRSSLLPPDDATDSKQSSNSRKISQRSFHFLISIQAIIPIKRCRDLLEKNDQSEKGKNIKEILAVYLELRDEGFITDEDYDYKKKKLLKEF